MRGRGIGDRAREKQEEESKGQTEQTERNKNILSELGDSFKGGGGELVDMRDVGMEA